MPKVIYINGASSSGKSTLARWIQGNCAQPFFYYSIDTLLETMPPEELARLRKSSKTKLIDWDQMFAAYFHSAAAISEAGLDIILDCPLYDVRVTLYKNHIARLKPISVLLACSPEELRRRELARGDRWVGLADFQAPRVAKSMEHMLAFDSGVTPVEEMGAKILTHL